MVPLGLLKDWLVLQNCSHGLQEKGVPWCWERGTTSGRRHLHPPGDLVFISVYVISVKFFLGSRMCKLSLFVGLAGHSPSEWDLEPSCTR